MLTTHTHGSGINSNRQCFSSARAWQMPSPRPLGNMICRLLVVWVLLAGATQTLAQNTSDLSGLNNDYQRVSSLAFYELAAKHSELKLDKGNIKSLVQRVKDADATGDVTQAIKLIAANQHVLQHNINDKAVALLVRLLFSYHITGIAADVITRASQSGDGYAEARLKFEYARYLASQQQWQEAFRQLKSIDINNTLSQDEADDALIILGSALQHQKKHREAVEYFSRLKPESKQYRIAQLNTAVAYIRQDWWTDAHIAIKSALKASPARNDEMTNRLYTVLGFSQIQHGFYRDARETFRHVHLKSSYANRALLGLGVAALHQEDFIGALNAFDHLKKKNEHDISVAESYLLSGFTLVQLKQDKTASASYTEAITYYEQQSALYNLLASAVANPEKLTQDQRSYLNKELQQYPYVHALRVKHQHLEYLQSQSLSSNTQKAINSLAARVNQQYVEQARGLLNKKQSTIDSYLSQSRFGLARLFDTQ